MTSQNQQGTFSLNSFDKSDLDWKMPPPKPRTFQKNPSKSSSSPFRRLPLSKPRSYSNKRQDAPSKMDLLFLKHINSTGKYLKDKHQKSLKQGHYEIEEEKIQKKVKVEKMTSSAPKYSGNGNEMNPTSNLNSKSVISENQIQKPEQSQSATKPPLNKNSIDLVEIASNKIEGKTIKATDDAKVLEIVYNNVTNEVLYKVEEGLPTNEKEVLSMTREQVIEKDPMLLIYFYESHLRFSKTKDFSPEDLKKMSGIKK